MKSQVLSLKEHAVKRFVIPGGAGVGPTKVLHTNRWPASKPLAIASLVLGFRSRVLRPLRPTWRLQREAGEV